MTLSANRRSVFKLGLAGAAALATPQIMIRAAHADAHSASLNMDSATHGFRLGDFEVATVNDGSLTFPDPHAIFGTNKSAEEVHGALDAHLLPKDRLVIGFAPTIVKTPTDLVLFDAGNGANRREAGAGRLLARLSNAGVTADQVTVVAITHMHPDHIGGLMEDGKPTFPNARYVTGQVEFDFWTHEDRMSGATEGLAKLVAANVKPLAEKMSFIGDGGEVVSGISGMAAFGHTPGHMIYLLESGGQKLAITADTANHFVLSLQHPDWEVRFDAVKDKAAEARRNVFGMIASERIPFIGYHMPFPSVGYVEPLGDGFRWVPETYQMDL
ncbi:MAG: MBL fold metallo-hydrolase [Rhizobiaceae bacterium]